MVSVPAQFLPFAIASAGKRAEARQVRRVMAELNERLAAIGLPADAVEAQA